ncbi:MAG: NUDIX domain-containing protein [Verrucomicrobiota bacterium]|nr:NUDIX domain-containing protein [Verrucomicrobiota bacterium]
MARGKVSAGLLMYRLRDGVEFFLAHPGGPFFVSRDEGHWTIPKGEVHEGEELLETAKREFQEEVGIPSSGPYLELGSIRQKGGKLVHGWAFEGAWDDNSIHLCNTFRMEWPPYSGKWQEFPEIDRVAFFKLDEARRKIKPTQMQFIDRLLQSLGTNR